MITFLDNYFFYYNIVFLYKIFEATEAIKLMFQMWLNNTSYSIRRLHTNNRGEYVTSELQSFLREQEIIYKTSTSYIHQQNGYAEWLNCIMFEKT